VRQKTLKDETLEEAEATRSRDKRARVMKIRNKGVESFASMEEFDVYSEESANIVDNLENYQKVEETEKALDEYERQYRAEIELNESKKNSRRTEERNRARLEHERLEEAKRVARASDALGRRPGASAVSGAAEDNASVIDGPQDLSLMQPRPLRCPQPKSRPPLSAPAPRRAIAGGACATGAKARALRIALSGLALAPWRYT